MNTLFISLSGTELTPWLISSVCAVLVMAGQSLIAMAGFAPKRDSLDSTRPGYHPGDIQISEFLADNKRLRKDEDGDSSDWIEIFNSGSTAANLDGWFLTDDPRNLRKWRCADVALPPNGYLVVFASGKNKASAAGVLHTNFKLSAEGEYLALVSPMRIVVSEFWPAYPKQYTDVSYGREHGPQRGLGYMAEPTPGAPNSSIGMDLAPEVQFSRASGTFEHRFSLTLSTSSAEAVIHYTLDGSFPTDLSGVYVEPIWITNSVQVRARAFQGGLLPGTVRSETFLLITEDITNFKSDLPVLFLHTLGQDVSAIRKFACLSVFEPIHGVTSFTNEPVLTTRLGMNFRGGVAPNSKASFTVEFWDESDQDKDLEILGLPAESDWVLYAPKAQDAVLIQNPFVHQLSRDMGRYAPRTRVVEVFLNTGGGPIGAANYNGIYVLEEKIKIAKNRIDLAQLRPEHVRLPEITGGYLLQIDLLRPGETGLFPYEPTMIVFVDPPEKEIALPERDPQEQYIRGYFQDFLCAINGPNWIDPGLGYASYIDAPSWIDWHILQVLSGNIDAMAKSTYFYKPRGGKIVFGPPWDFDLAFGSGGSVSGSWGTLALFGGWWRQLLRDPELWQQWIDRYQESRRSHFSLASMHSLIDRLTAEVRQAEPREHEKWPSRFRNYHSAIDFMKNWVSNKVGWIDQQLVPAPVFSAAGGNVTPGFTLSISGPKDAIIYFTLDGTDPRLPKGELSPKAQVYAEPLTLNQTVGVIARARNPNKRQMGGPPISSPWSGPVAANFAVDQDGTSQPQLKLTPGVPLHLSFLAVAGRAYTIQFRDEMGVGSWQTSSSVTGPSVGGTITLEISATNKARFYRVVTR